MKKFNLNPIYVNKFMHQNKANYIDCIDGCLIDHLMVSTKRGYMALIETYATPNSSTYTVYFSTDENEIYDVWAPYEKQYHEYLKSIGEID